MRLARALGFVLLLSGLSLLTVAVAGHWTPIGDYPSVTPPSDWEDRFDPDLPPLTRSLEALYKAAEAAAPKPFAEMPPDEVMQLLFYKVSERFSHGDRTTYDLFNNWFMALVAVFDPQFRYIHAADSMLRFGHSAICDQISYILYRMAERAGIQGRQVALTGHIVFEAFYDGEWHLYDPDFEVAPRTPEGKVLGVETIAQDAALVRWAYGERLAQEPEVLEGVVEYYTTQEDNTPWDYPPVGWQREERLQNMKFVLPVLLAALGAGLLAATRARRAPAPSPSRASLRSVAAGPGG